MVLLNSRKPWKAAIVGLIFGPVIGMLYANKGKLAFNYFVVLLVLAIATFIAAHLGILTVDPRKAVYLVIFVVQLIGAFHCFRMAKSKQEEALKWYARWHNIIIVFMILPISGALLFRTFCYEPFNVRSSSMEPTLYPEDYFFAAKQAYGPQSLPKRGDLIIFTVRKDGQRAQYIKRIIGLPGDTIQLNGKTISVNGAPLQQRAVESGDDMHNEFVEAFPEGKEIHIFENKDSTGVPELNGSSIQVPENQYFVAGDYRDMSKDSRNGMGYVSREDITGKPIAIIWNEKTFKFSYKPIQ